MTILKIEHGGMPETVLLPTSKSYANRTLILAALKGSITLLQMPEASDVTYLIAALKQIGLEIGQSNNSVTVTNAFPACERAQGAEVDVGEGGTTARFLACLLVQGKAPYTLVLGERLRDRPWQSFIEMVNKYGGKAELKGNRLSLQGPLALPANLEVDCTLTTQFASGFQLALAWSGTNVIPLNLRSSESYWLMTENLIAFMKAVSVFSIPIDWSSAGYPMAFAALNQSITFPGLKIDPNQADSKICQVLEQMGCLSIQSNSIVVNKWQPRRMDLKLEVGDCLDLFPTLAYLVAHIEGIHRFNGVSNLVHKESDRLQEVIQLLTSFGIKTEVPADEFLIHGRPDLKLPRQNLVLPDDHRIVMMAALFLRQHLGGEISPAEAVRKSYPNFWQLLT